MEKPALFESNLIPIDWSLKTRLRFCSRAQFKCCTNLKSIHESQAIFNFSKLNEFYDNLEKSQIVSFFFLFPINTITIINIQKFQRNDTEDMYKTLFCESIIYWMFPFLPWLKLYPRSSNLNLAKY
jgi:hypothetical protein